MPKNPNVWGWRWASIWRYTWFGRFNGCGFRVFGYGIRIFRDTPRVGEWSFEFLYPR